MTVLFEEDKLPYGKYKGERISKVIKKDKKYLLGFNKQKANQDGSYCISDEVFKSRR